MRGSLTFEPRTNTTREGGLLGFQKNRWKWSHHPLGVGGHLILEKPIAWHLHVLYDVKITGWQIWTGLQCNARYCASPPQIIPQSGHDVKWKAAEKRSAPNKKIASLTDSDTVNLVWKMPIGIQLNYLDIQAPLFCDWRYQLCYSATQQQFLALFCNSEPASKIQTDQMARGNPSETCLSGTSQGKNIIKSLKLCPWVIPE